MDITDLEEEFFGQTEEKSEHWLAGGVIDIYLYAKSLFSFKG